MLTSEGRNKMKICYNCFHEVDESMRFCVNCGFRLEDQTNLDFPEAIPCGTTLYGRYLTGRVLGQDSLLITYIAQDSRTGNTVAIREFFPSQICERVSASTVSAAEAMRGGFQQGKELFLQKAEELSDLNEETGQAACLQSYFNQNNTAYMVIEYTDADSLLDYLNRADDREFRREAGRLLFPQTAEAAGSLPGAAFGSETVPEFFFPELIPDCSGRKNTPEDERNPVDSVSSGEESDSDVPADSGEEPGSDLPADSRMEPVSDVSADSGEEPGSDLPAGSGEVPDSFVPPASGIAPDLTSSAFSQDQNVSAAYGSAAEDREKSPEMVRASGTEEGSPRENRPWTEQAGHTAPHPPLAAIPGDSGKSGKNSIFPFIAVIAALLICVVLIISLLVRIFSGIGTGSRPGPYIYYSVQRFFRSLHSPLDNWTGSENDNKTESGSDHKSEGKNNIPYNKPTEGMRLKKDGNEEDDGITPGNYNNSGFFAACGNDIYYGTYGLTCWPESDPDREEKRTDSSPSFINTYGDCLYYIEEFDQTICRYDPVQDTEVPVLDYSGLGDPFFYTVTMYIRENRCFLSIDHYLFLISMEELEGEETADLSQAMLLVDDFNAQDNVYPGLCFAGGRIYYGGTGGLTSIELDGSDKKLVSSREGNLLTDGSDIFFQYGSSIYCVRADGTEELFLDIHDDSNYRESIEEINYSDGWIYYIRETETEYELWKIKGDGSDHQYIKSFGDAKDTLIHFCLFPGDEYGYIYWIRHTEDNDISNSQEKLLLHP